jgi:hypothetical protein
MPLDELVEHLGVRRPGAGRPARAHVLVQIARDARPALEALSTTANREAATG